MRATTGVGLLSVTLVALTCWTGSGAQSQDPVPPACRYRLTDLGNFPGWDRTRATAINDGGVIVGTASTYVGLISVALVWERGKPTQLPAPAGYRATTATAINAAGQIAGSLRKTDRLPQYVCGCLWTDRKPRALPTPKGLFGEATDVNASGTVVGWCQKDQASPASAWSWKAGKLALLSAPAGRPVTLAFSVNDAGRVAGLARAATRETNSRAAFWARGRAIELSSLRGRFDLARRLNNRGQVVGDAATADEKLHAALWDMERRTDLGTLGGPSSQAWGINDRGQVVGQADANGVVAPGSNFLDTDPRAFLWEDGKMLDLNALIPRSSEWKLESATAINNRGEILAIGRRGDASHPVLLTPVTRR